MSSKTASTPLILAHYFGPYPPHIDNVAADSDYCARNYLKITGESSAHAACGGLLRNRPYPKPTYVGADGPVLDAKEQIEHAKAAGIDGFYCNIMNNSTGQPSRRF